MSNGATGNAHVNALVFIAAYALDQVESLAQANSLGGGHTPLPDHIVVRPYPGAPHGDGDGTIDPA
jgi:hypothetical protein